MSNAMKTMSEIRSKLFNNVSSRADRLKILKMVADYDKDLRDTKDDYLMALLFPEYAPPVRIPSPFGLPSTLHTQKQEAYLTTNAAGEGMIEFTLQDLHFNLCYATGTVPAGSTGMGSYTIDGHNTTLYSPAIYDQRYLCDTFSHARVIGASVRICYIGRHDEEQGFITVAHLQNQNLCGVTDRDIEEGYHTKRMRISEGVRLSWTPFDEKDFQYTELNTRVVPNDPDEADDENYIKNPVGSGSNEITVNNTPFVNCINYELRPQDLMYVYSDVSGQTDDEAAHKNRLQVQMRVLSMEHDTAQGGAHNYQTMGVTGNRQVGWVDINHQLGSDTNIHLIHGPQNWLGMGARAGDVNSQFPQIQAVYYKGLPPNSQCLRIDVVRHLECIPRSEHKQFMTLERPVFCDHTQRLAAQLQHKQSRLQTSTLQEAPAIVASTNLALMQTRTPEQVLDVIPMVDNAAAIANMRSTNSSWFNDAIGSMGSMFGPALGSLGGAMVGEMFGPVGAAAGAQIGAAAGASLFGTNEYTPHMINAVHGMSGGTANADKPFVQNPGKPNQLMITM